MSDPLSRADIAAVEPSLVYDRGSGELTGARLAERAAVLALQAGSALTRQFGHRGYRLGCNLVSTTIVERDIVVRLNPDAHFAIPLADGYWSRLLNRRYDYEEEIEAFLRSVADVRYSFIDCGANFGYWSVLASSQPFGRQVALAIEASPKNMVRLRANARLNGNRFRCMNAAIGAREGGFARITGQRHEAFGTALLDSREQDAIGVVSLDSLVSDGAIDASSPTVIKLDVEGVEIEALKGAVDLLAADTVAICEDHGSDRSHGVTRYLCNATPLTVYVFDPSVSRFVLVDDLKVLDRVKRHRWVGYNVFATSSVLWHERLLSARRRDQ